MGNLPAQSSEFKLYDELKAYFATMGEVQSVSVNYSRKCVMPFLLRLFFLLYFTQLFVS